MIPGSANPLLLVQQDTGYKVQRSLRFNSSDSAYLSRTPASAGNRKTWTLSFWIKFANNSGSQTIISNSNSSNNNGFYLSYDSSGKLDLNDYVTSNYTWRLYTAAVFRDFSAWYHVVFAFDTTQATAANRARLYVNGNEITAFSSVTYPSQNADGVFNNTQLIAIGNQGAFNANYLNGYLAECYLIDGQQLTPSSFGETNATTGQWVPRQFSGSYGSQGWKLTFSDNSNTTAATLGKDTSGNGNNWTPTNFAINTSTLNYSSYWVAGGNNNAPIGPNNAFDGSTSTYFRTNGSSNTQTWTPPSSIAYTSLRVYVYNIVGSSTNVLFVNGVAQTTPTSTGWFTPSGVSSPLTSIEIRETASTALGIAAVEINSGILLDRSWPGHDSLVDTPTSYGTDTGAGGEVRGNYCTLNPLSGSSTHPLANGNLEKVSTSGSGNRFGTIGITSGKFYWENAFTVIGSSVASCGISSNGRDANNISELKIYETPGTKYNGSSSSAYGASWGANDVIGIAFDADNGTLAFYKNGVSQGTAFTGLTGLTWFPVLRDDGGYSGWINFGQRPFAYTAPSGFKALCDTNLPAPVIAKSASAFDVKLYTGNGSTQTISGLGFSPDLVWGKYRSTAWSHAIFDVVRGATARLESDTTSAEASNSGLTAFNSDGFTVGSNTSLNANGGSYVAWCWDAGSSTVTNTQGSITSSVRANASAGFSIVTWTGTGATGTVGHGLGVTPSLIICKNRGQNVSSWDTYHSSIGNTGALRLNSTSGTITASDLWNNTSPTSTVFTVTTSDSNNASGQGIIAYCFAPVAGYSSAFTYTGNGSTDGSMVWLGFRPRYLIFKRTDAAEDWLVLDSARDSYNVASARLLPNSSAAEGTGFHYVDFLSNGFKIRNTQAGMNASNGTFIGFAFAESPFQYARAR